MTTDIAKRIQTTRLRLGLDEASMAVYLGVTPHALLKWENGQRVPSGPVVRLLDVLGVLEAVAPGIHATLTPAPRPQEAPRRRGRPPGKGKVAA